MDSGLRAFTSALYSSSGYDLSGYSDKSLRRRLDRLLEEDGVPLSSVIERLGRDVGYGERVLNRLTVNTSELFRDPGMWLFLRSRVLPRFQESRYLNVWHSGCSKGQEVYSMLILLDQLGYLSRSRLYASDINTEVLEYARRGVYPFRFNLSYLENFDRVVNVNPLNYEDEPNVPFGHYFDVDRGHDTMTVRHGYRMYPAFRHNDLVRMSNPFYVRYDIIFCRNVLIYFNSDLKRRLSHFFYDLLYPGGFLVLGNQESVFDSPFERFSSALPIYVKG